ncbi:hypothetical protein NQ314_005391 [Rhamnusium bicolor]|uniref:CHK kinase-like domain-containing protein n=1 Tax=Rhamnusium bicolor TaxID=1586634 RepID=A0AAV8ZIU4_9CUCU|nr:hypothetical protein NQ314_005391 [Rhamnusium bicolor]
MAEEKIARIEQLLRENNCSLVLKVNITTKDEENGTQEVLSTVAKVIPTNEYMRFAFEYSFKNEVAFYNIIVPTLQEFQRKRGMDHVADFFPKMYVSRQNLDEDNDIVDNNAVILMDNLIMSGYKNVDRMVGFDLKTTKFILKDLAAFHAIPLALKHLDPQGFEQKIKPYLVGFKRPPPPPPSKNGGKSQNPDEALIEVLEEFDEFLPLQSLLRQHLRFNEFVNNPEGLYSTICHGDMWVNNIMTKFKDGKPIKNKFVDFQMCTNNSLAKDLFFFLWSSVQQPILENSLDDLIKFYYENFIEHLNQLKCDSTPFTFDAFFGRNHIS